MTEWRKPTEVLKEIGGVARIGFGETRRKIRTTGIEDAVLTRITQRMAHNTHFVGEDTKEALAAASASAMILCPTVADHPELGEPDVEPPAKIALCADCAEPVWVPADVETKAKPYCPPCVDKRTAALYEGNDGD